MAKFESTCPNCGAPVVFQSSISIMVVCEYCDTTIVRKDLDLEKVGKMGALANDASPIYLGLEGRYRDHGFTVIGRLQIEYGAGVWNEWFIRFSNDQTAWIGEAQGEYMVYDLVDSPEQVPSYQDLEVGQTVFIGARKKSKGYTIVDIRKARCISGEGELPFVVGSGYEFCYADGRSTTKAVATIDYSEDPPVQFAGTWVDFDLLNFSEPRTFHDW